MGLKVLNICLKIYVLVITLEREETPIACCSVLGESLPFDQYLGPVSVLLQSLNLTRLNSPIFLMLVRQQEKSQKYFNLLAFN